MLSKQELAVVACACHQSVKAYRESQGIKLRGWLGITQEEREADIKLLEAIIEAEEIVLPKDLEQKIYIGTMLKEFIKLSIRE